jgi:diadenosine tetraphosphatase ApaH/serine/threonine PP2A family protein phosphatase
MHRPGQSLTMKYFHNLILPRNVRIMIGVGAVGQPRDDDPRAAAILYNTTANSATLLRIKYDVDAAQKRILDAGLPSSLASRLALGK